ncbi:glutathione transferase GstA [Sphingomonas parva]|uniref:Glutathione transferase GstA n=1 Tax=Sphingomonas parva TaxID=2555898 RepID=A0A4Y8ZY77_9SPHN|nr:glutathione transferase GstA [Sphingomonas parva]TFI60265.1 glutathione transferase GstA [Sphingomonas parva]
MRLYYTPGTCSLAPHIVAREAGLPLDLVKVDLATKRAEDGGDYLAVNPKGPVPALVLDDGFVLTEAAVVIQYLADLAPQSGLLPPAGTRARYVAQQWLNYVATELHKGFGPLWHKETPAEMRAIVRAQLADRFAFLDRELAARPYLTGNAFAAPDAYAFTVLSWGRYLSIDLARWPNVAAYVDRIAARSRVREALIAEGLIEAEAA